MHLKLSVPLPPPLNNAYFTDKRTGRRVLSAAGRSYKALIIARVKHTRFALAERSKATRYAMTYAFHFPDNRRTDLSNRPKLLEDAIAEACNFDDSQVYDIHISRADNDKDRPRCEVWIGILE